MTKIKTLATKEEVNALTIKAYYWHLKAEQDKIKDLQTFDSNLFYLSKLL